MRLLIITTIMLFLQACSGEPKINNGHLETVKIDTVSDTLFYSGTIKPLSSSVITSIADGVIIDMPFQYGDKVTKGKTLFVISSAKFLSDYKSALLQYVKAKSEFNTNQTQLKESEFLHKNELISDDEFKMKQSSYYASQLGLLQARDALETILRQMDLKDVDLKSLTIADIDKITEAMHLQQKSENISMVAPVEGFVLSAIGKGNDDNKKFGRGDTVKQGDVLAMIGDMNGLSVNVRVNELVVNQLQKGQKVQVTGIAFPESILQGQIERVDHQGEASNGGLPTFSVDIRVATLTPEQREKIHVGMSAQVKIITNESKSILIPVKALAEKSGQSYVKKYDVKDHKLHDVIVVTGKSTQDSVTIISGLNSGDRIVIPA